MENCATTTRERCGGQGYLTANYLGMSIGFSHAGISAEGDNAVLIQKVAKELMAAVQKGNIVYPKVSWNKKFNNEGLIQLIMLREQKLLALLSKNMQQKMKNASLFDVWMKQESDTIQALGKSFGERICATAFHSKLANAPLEFTHIFELYCLHSIVNTLSIFYNLDLITSSEGRALIDAYHSSIKVVAAFSLTLVDFIGVDKDMVRAPIANDWVAYNAVDNRGELKPKI